VIAILTVVLGGGIVVGTAVSAAVPTVAASLARSESYELAVAGVERLQLDAGASSLSIEFDDVPEATLEVRDSGRGSWTLDRDGAALRVLSPDGPFLSWFGSGSGTATLVLPTELAGIDADIDFGAGSLRAEGEFGTLDLDIGAGEADVTGSAEELIVSIGAGRSDLDLTNVRTAQIEVSAGALTGSLSGAVPEEVGIVVSAGSLDLELPDELYAVTSDVSAGGFDNGLRELPSSRNTVSVEVAAGDVTLRAG
jgi:hypothetical protein